VVSRSPSNIADPVGEIMRIAKQVAGIDLGESKRTMVESRLGKRLRQLDCGMAEYAARVHDDPSELVVCLDLLTTNHTFWLREADHFRDFERRVLPELAPRRRARIWCAATATGEEPYTIALCLARSLPDFPAWDAALLATDISTRALARAAQALYTEERVSHLTDADRRIALDLVEQGPPKIWRVKPELKRLVHLARLNLMDATWPMRGPFDVIFCRNVMIYFDRPTQARLVNRLAALLAPGGTLYVGHSESLSAIDHPLRTLAPATYKKV
jgi:chemotaxis protein methyltransferase CheR